MRKESAGTVTRNDRRYLYCFLSLILICSSLGVYAELPPPVYEELKSEAGEYLKIEITNIETKDTGECRVGIFYSAVVLSVFRSNSGLQAGDEIEINSWNMKDSSSCVGGGPKEPKLLAVGWAGGAYLSPINGSAGVFYPAAYGDSFVDTGTGQQ